MKGLLGIILAGLVLGATLAGAENDHIVEANGSTAQEAPVKKTSVKVFRYTNRSGTTSFSDRPPTNARYEVIYYSLSCYACNLKSTVDWNNVPLQLSAFHDTIKTAAGKYGVDPALVRAVIHAESAFKPDARSKKGALGLMQLMPGTARDMGVVNAMSPEENIHGGVRYLAWLLKRTSGNTLLATAAYNAGPGAVERFNGIPPYEETKTYVKRVKILHDRYKNALARI